MTKRDMAHISLHLDSAVAKAARIQAIKEGVSLKAWVTQAIMRQLGENQRFVAAAIEEQLAAREPQAGKTTEGREA
jgi:hypothetical protein